MNPKFEIEVTKNQFNSWLKYFEESGYEIKENEYTVNLYREITYMTDIPNFYDNTTPIALKIKFREWKYYIYIRIPFNDKF